MPSGVSLQLFLTGRKGLAVLNSVLESGFDPENIGVTIGTDSGVTDDGSKSLQVRLASAGIDPSRSFVSTGESYGVAAGWRQMLDPSRFRQLFVFHDSLLPKYRGFNPLVSALIAGDKSIGGTCLVASDKYDQGPIVAQAKRSISYPMKISAAIRIIEDCYRELTIDLLSRLSAAGHIEGLAQDERAASYSLWRDEHDYWIDWSQPASQIARMIDAVGEPYGGAKTWSHSQSVVLSIDDAAPISDRSIVNRTPGKLLDFDDGKAVVVCGEGLLRLDTVRTDAEHIKLPMRTRLGLPSVTHTG